MRYTPRIVPDPALPTEKHTETASVFSRQRKRAVVIGALLGMAVYNMYLAPGHGAVGGSLVRPTGLMVALLLFTWGYQFRHMVAGAVSGVAVLSGVALTSELWALVGSGASGLGCGLVLERTMRTGRGGGSWVVMMWALSLSALWVRAVVWAMQPGDDGKVDPGVMLLSLQGIIVPALAWVGCVVWRRGQRMWGLLVVGFSLTVGVTFCLSWLDALDRADQVEAPAATQPASP